ncbi:MAG: COX15/CtaA family protein, partial [Maribacter sp.]|nr:COX15/CtaA family protein [Maribacter sp.]
FMNESKLMHETVLIEQVPIWKNFIEGKSGVQFIHRYLAYIVVGFILCMYYKTRFIQLSGNQRKGINGLMAMVFIQFFLGVFTLIYSVPVLLGVLHQIFAFFLLGNMTFVLHRFSR